jgi:methylenetetrahydrofolate dehydrogenase (NADP+)/methenyltetrahydrofolate cyclohydrolase
MSSPLLLTAKPVLSSLHEEIRKRADLVRQKIGRAPHLAVVLVGEDPASVIYTRKKGETAIALGLDHQTLNFPATATVHEVQAAILKLNVDKRVDGILIQRPLPKAFREEDVVYWVAPEKDVDAFHPENTGRMVLGLPCFQPCTPAGVMEILKHYGIDSAGKTAAVIGRSSIVGKPMASLLLQANATVIQCHSRTKNLAGVCQSADIVVAAIGKAEFVTPDFIKPGAVVVDVGINRKADGKLAGDVDFEKVAPLCSAITPVPGGVGPMTIGILLRNTVWAAEQ